MTVGGRAGSPSAAGAVAAGAFKLDVIAGQGLRFQIVNAATTRFFRLILTDHGGTKVPLVRVGGEGGLLDNAVVEGDADPLPPDTFAWNYTSGEVLLAPGDRVDVVAVIPAGATVGQVLTMWTQDFMRTGGGSQFANIPTVPVAHLGVVAGSVTPYTIAAGTALRASIPGAEVEALGAPTINLLDPAAFSPAKLGMASQEIVLSNNVDRFTGGDGACRPRLASRRSVDRSSRYNRLVDGSVAERLATLFGMDAGGVSTAYLFGSAARDELRADSDIDVGVLLAEGVAGTDACLAIEERIERALGRRAQVVDLSRAPADLVQRVLRDGVLLLDRDPTIRVRFEIRRRNEWFDLQPLLREYRRARGAA